MKGHPPQWVCGVSPSRYLSTATPFRAPCPASGDTPWPEDIQRFFATAPDEMAAIPEAEGAPDSACAIYCLRNGMEFEPVGIMPEGEMRIVRESPTSAYIRFKAGSVEPAHHHTFGHDLVVIKGKKKVWNLTRRRATTWWTEISSSLRPGTCTG